MKSQNWERQGTCARISKPSLISPVTSYFESRLMETFALIPAAMRTGDFHSPLPWGYEKNLIQHPRGYISKTLSNGGQWTGQSYDGSLGNEVGFSWPQIDRPAGLRNRALGRLDDKISSGLNLSESAFEAGQTAKMLNLFQRVDRVLRSTVPRYKRLSRLAGALPSIAWRKNPKQGGRYTPYRDFDFLKSRKTGDPLSSAYLELTYGLTPLVNDLYGIADEVVRFVNNAKHQRFRGRVREQQAPVKASVRVSDGGTFTTMVTRNGYYGASVTVQMRPEDPGFDISRWTSLNPVYWGYNLIPLSFVLDYVYDIGGFLELSEAAVKYHSRFEGGFEESINVLEDKLSFSRQWSQAGYSWLADFEGTRSYVGYSRTILGSYPLPDRPTFSLSLGSKQLMNIGALLASVVSHQR